MFKQKLAITTAVKCKKNLFTKSIPFISQNIDEEFSVYEICLPVNEVKINKIKTKNAARILFLREGPYFISLHEQCQLLC